MGGDRSHQVATLGNYSKMEEFLTTLDYRIVAFR